MSYNNNQGNNQQESKYDRAKDNVIFKKGSNATGKRYLNVMLYSYDNHPAALRICPCSQNSNPNAEQNKKWINGKSISQITKDEAQALIKDLQAAVNEF